MYMYNDVQYTVNSVLNSGGFSKNFVQEHSNKSVARSTRVKQELATIVELPSQEINLAR